MAQDQPSGAAALIVAAGRGTRMGTERPKQYLEVAGQPVLARTIGAFLGVDAVRWILTVIHEDDRESFKIATQDIVSHKLLEPTTGAGTRAASVRNGLEALAALRPARVLIHDAARPFVPPDVIADIIAALDDAPGAVAALPVVDALWRDDDGHIGAAVPREGLWRAQTPQGFRFDAILDAHRAGDPAATDDVAIARAAGMEVRIVPGREEMFKITTPQDLERAEAFLREPKRVTL